MTKYFSTSTLKRAAIFLPLLLGSACAPTAETIYYDALITEEKQLPDLTYEYVAILSDPSNTKLTIRRQHQMPWKVGQKIIAGIPTHTSKPSEIIVGH